jgi:hypothetical protein
MPIPPFDSNAVLPPHLGDPRQPDEISPYPCSSLELCTAFATSPERVRILDGFLRLRQELRRHGMTQGFQWIDGSFLEDVESTESRPPGDIDVVTFYWSADPDLTRKLVAAFPDLANRAAIKAQFYVDHFPIDAGYDPEFTIEATRYWCGLFSHTRSGAWKGMLRIDLDTAADDLAAARHLATRP